MPVMRDDETYMIESPKMNRLESAYLLEIVRGLCVAMRHALRSIGRGKGAKTMYYPEERRENMTVMEGGMEKSNYRGVHRLNRDEQGREKCVACFMCATACPVKCIEIEAGPAPWDDREKYPVTFVIDELRCVSCGMCEEACPEDAIELTPMYDMVSRSRDEMMYDKEKLLAMYDQTVDDKPM